MSRIFSFQGRAGRIEYWQRSGLAVLVFAAAAMVLILGAGIGLPMLAARQGWGQGAVDVLGTVAAVLQLANIVVYVWATLAVAVRRMHDLGAPGRSLLSTRALWQSGFARGTVGPNAYGADPLA